MGENEGEVFASGRSSQWTIPTDLRNGANLIGVKSGSSVSLVGLFVRAA